MSYIQGISEAILVSLPHVTIDDVKTNPLKTKIEETIGVHWDLIYPSESVQEAVKMDKERLKDLSPHESKRVKRLRAKRSNYISNSFGRLKEYCFLRYVRPTSALASS